MSVVKKATACGPAFEIVSTLVYSHGLPPNPALANEPRQCLLLGYAMDRLLLAATEFKWPRVLALLGHARAHQALLREIEHHLRWEHADAALAECLFVVRLSFDRNGRLTLMSGQRPPHPPGTLVYPMSLPPPTAGRKTPRRQAPLVPVYVDQGFLVASPFTRHKTTHRAPYSDARARVGLHPATPLTQGEVLLVNADGEVMDGGFTTLYFWRQEQDGGGSGAWGWRTPRHESGTKLGVSRRWALEHAAVTEVAIMAKDLVDGEKIWLSSAVGGFIRGVVSFRRHEQDSSGSDAAA